GAISQTTKEPASTTTACFLLTKLRALQELENMNLKVSSNIMEDSAFFFSSLIATRLQATSLWTVQIPQGQFKTLIVNGRTRDLCHSDVLGRSSMGDHHHY